MLVLGTYIVLIYQLNIQKYLKETLKNVKKKMVRYITYIKDIYEGKGPTSKRSIKLLKLDNYTPQD